MLCVGKAQRLNMDYRLAGGKLRNRGVHVCECVSVCVTCDSRPANGSRVNEQQDGLLGNFTCCQRTGCFCALVSKRLKVLL